MAHVFSQSSRLVQTIILILCMLATLLGTAFVAAANPSAILASTQDAPVTESYDTQDPHACQTLSDNDGVHPAGNDLDSTYAIRAAKVTIDPKEDSFRVCSHGNVDMGGSYPDSVSAWVMLTEADGSGSSNWAQVGIVRCNYDGSDPTWCDTSGSDNGTEAHFFYQSHGCAELGANTVNLGDADFYAHDYEIYDYNGVLYVKVDGVVEYSVTISTSERLNCWLNDENDVIVKVDCETADQGDLCAHEVDKLNYDGLAYIQYGYTNWTTPSSLADPCDHIEDTYWFDAHCDVVDSDSFDVWQVHDGG